MTWSKLQNEVGENERGKDILVASSERTRVESSSLGYKTNEEVGVVAWGGSKRTKREGKFGGKLKLPFVPGEQGNRCDYQDEKGKLTLSEQGDVGEGRGHRERGGKYAKK